jgi:peptide/nickel transport system permease protein
MPFYLFLRRLRRSCRVLRADRHRAAGADCLFAPWLAPLIPTGRTPPRVCNRPTRSTGWAPTARRDLLSRLIYGTRPALGLVA